MKTPMEELIEFMDNIAVSKDVDLDLQNAMTQLHSHIQIKATELLEKEKQVIIEAHSSGTIINFYLEEGQTLYDISEQYYKETFNKEL